MAPTTAGEIAAMSRSRRHDNGGPTTDKNTSGSNDREPARILKRMRIVAEYRRSPKRTKPASSVNPLKKTGIRSLFSRIIVRQQSPMYAAMFLRDLDNTRICYSTSHTEPLRSKCRRRTWFGTCKKRWTRKGDAAHLVLRLITWKHVPAGQFLGRLGMTINYSKPHLIANTMSCVLFDSRDSSAAFRLSPARGVAMTSMLRIKNAADSS